MFSRRKVAKMLGGAPFVAALGSHAPPPGVGQGVPAIGGVPYPSSPNVLSTSIPLMPKEAALKFIFGQRHLREELETAYYESHRRVDSIDHDLMALKSFSWAAKVTFQRQRNVARAMEHTLNEDKTPYDKIEKITRTMVRKLMWGHE